MNIIASGNYNKVPLMLGYNSREGMLFDFVEKVYPKLERFPKDLEVFVPYSLGAPKGSNLSTRIAAEIKKYYFNNEVLSEKNIDSIYKVRVSLQSL